MLDVMKLITGLHIKKYYLKLHFESFGEANNLPVDFVKNDIAAEWDLP